MDTYAENYNPDAEADDGSCAGYPDNGEYSLSFDASSSLPNGDGLNYVTIEDFQQSPDGDGSFSVGGWVQNNGSDYTTIMSKRSWDNGSGYFGWHLSYENDGSMGLYMQENTSNFLNRVTTDQIYNEFFHIVAVFEAGSSISLYINGELVNTSSTSLSSFSNDDAPLLISSLQDPGWWIWDGLIDDLFIYDDALNDNEVQEIYSNNPSSVINNLIGHWKFNAGDGDILYDHSGNANHGTINGATWSDDVYVPPVPPVPGGNNSLSFDGVDDYVDLTPIDLSSSNQMTLMCWIN
ncbi:uncharacterized protein METZ01_LOCUS206880, partial [marine metagenome]